MNNFAVIETGGKQYRVKVGDVLRVEKLGDDLASGAAVTFDKVLLKAAGDRVEVGVPYLEGASVEGKVLRALRGDRKMIFRYHPKTRYRKKKTHRQWYTEVEITKIPA
ncbi:MAG: 50S ribosomal protein L21 [Candidatus Jorgensenbacteria bacterium]